MAFAFHNEGAREGFLARLEGNRYALTRERRGVDAQCVGFDDPKIGGDAVPRTEEDNVPYHKLARIYLDGFPVAHYRSPAG